jgi:hypothetical protein
MTTRSFRISLAIAMTLALASSSGCAGVGQRVENWCYGLSIWSQEKHELADIRQDTRVALAEQEQEALRLEAQREVEAARLDAERRRLEMDFCRANQEALQRQVKSNVRETVESKVAFNVEQGLEVGELQVDVEALQALLKQREQEAQQRPPQEAVKRPCPCCDAPCGCEPGMIRRFCPHCRNKPCEAEKDCGGPEALKRLEQQPVKRPLKPAEIPMKLPVRLNFGFQQPEMEAARIRRVPELPQEAVKRPCDRCTEPNGYCPVPCTQSAPPQAPSAALDKIYEYQPPLQPTVPPAEPQIGPPPVPEAEARRQQPASPHGIRLGRAPLGPNGFAWQSPVWSN